MTDLVSLGPWVLVFGVALILLESVVGLVWTVQLARRGRTLALALERDRAFVQADVERLRATLEETRRLWKPWERALRRLRHPLVAALLGSLWRRWSG